MREIHPHILQKPLISFFFAIIWCANNRKRIIACGASSLLVYVLWVCVALPTWGVAPGNDKDLYSVPSQQTALLIKRHGAEFSDEDWSVINSVYSNPSKMVENYNPIIADDTKSHFIYSASLEDKGRYMLWLVGQLPKHPVTMIGAFSALCCPSWAVTNLDTTNVGCLLYYPDNLASWSSNRQSRIDFFFNHSNGSTTREDVEMLLDDVFKSSREVALSTALKEMYGKLGMVASLPLCKAIYACWLPLFVLAYCLRQRNRCMGVCLIPIILSAIVIMVGPVSFQRYYVPLLYAAPLLVALPFVCNRNRGRSNDGR